MKKILSLLIALVFIGCNAPSTGYQVIPGTIQEVNEHDLLFCWFELNTVQCAYYPLEVFRYNNDSLPYSGQVVGLYDCQDRHTDDCGLYELGFETVPALKEVN